MESNIEDLRLKNSLNYSIEYHPQRCDGIVITKSYLRFLVIHILLAIGALSDERPDFSLRHNSSHPLWDKKRRLLAEAPPIIIIDMQNQFGL